MSYQYFSAKYFLQNLKNMISINIDGQNLGVTIRVSVDIYWSQRYCCIDMQQQGSVTFDTSPDYRKNISANSQVQITPLTIKLSNRGPANTKSVCWIWNHVVWNSHISLAAAVSKSGWGARYKQAWQLTTLSRRYTKYLLRMTFLRQWIDIPWY